MSDPDQDHSVWIRIVGSGSVSMDSNCHIRISLDSGCQIRISMDSDCKIRIVLIRISLDSDCQIRISMDSDPLLKNTESGFISGVENSVIWIQSDNGSKTFFQIWINILCRNKKISKIFPLFQQSISWNPNRVFFWIRIRSVLCNKLPYGTFTYFLSGICPNS